MSGLGLYPTEDVSGKALRGVGQAAQSYGAMGQERKTVTVTKGGRSAGGAIGGAAGGAMAGASVGMAAGQWQRKLFNGLAQVIVQPNESAKGEIILNATAEGLKSTKLILTVE